MRDLVSFLQSKKREKHPCRSLTFKPATLLKVTLLHACFSRFWNGTNGTKQRKASRKICTGVLLKNVLTFAKELWNCNGEWFVCVLFGRLYRFFRCQKWDWKKSFQRVQSQWSVTFHFSRAMNIYLNESENYLLDKYFPPD